MTRVSALGSKNARFGVVAAVALGTSAAFAALLLFQLPNPSAATAVDDIGEATAAFLAAAGCAWAARKAAGKIRLGWALLAISAACWGAGETIWSIYEVGLQVAVPFPGWSDVGFVAAIPFSVAGIRAFWTAPRGTSTRWRVWLDAAIVALALLFTAWALGLRLVWNDFEDPLVERFLDLVYPVGDILIGTVLILAIRRAAHWHQPRLLLLLAGVAAVSVADSAFGYLTVTGSYTVHGSVLDTGWFAGYLMIGLAAVWPWTRNEVVETAPVDLLQLVLPWLTVLAAGVSALGLAVTGQGLDAFLTVITGVVLILLTANTVLTSRDFLGMLVKSRMSEETLAEVIARAPAGVVTVGADLRIIEANPRFSELLLGSSDNAPGQLITHYFTPAEAGRFVEKIENLRAGAEAVEADSEAVRKDGKKVWVHWSATAVATPDGGSDYFIAMFEDTTARHEAEAAATASLELMQRLNALKTEFLRNVSHEFKTALIGIQGFSEFMRDVDQLDVNDARAFAADINRDAQRLDRMVTEMLALDRVESARANFRVGPVDLNALIRREAASAQTAVPAGVVILDLASSLPMVSGDEGRLAEVVRTLLDNAVRYSPELGRITVTTAVSGDVVAVAVKDEGEAGRADFDNRLFAQNDIYANNAIHKVVGTGLGLGIVRQVVEMHGGRVWVDRLDGKGSVFNFTLPVAPVVAATHSGGMVA